MHFCDPKDVTYIGCGLLASMSGSIESVALSLNHETVDRNTKLAFSEYQGWGWEETCKRNKLSQRSSALQPLCQLPSVTLVAGRPQRGAQIPRAFPFVHSRKKASPPTSFKERLSAHISLSLFLPRYWNISGNTFALRPCSVIEGDPRSLKYPKSLWGILEILCTPQEESSTWSGGEGQEDVCLFPISTMGGTEINEIWISFSKYWHLYSSTTNLLPTRPRMQGVWSLSSHCKGGREAPYTCINWET